MISSSGMSGAGSAMALDGMQGHALTICDLPRLFRRIIVPALPCAGATGAVSGTCVAKGEHVPHSCLS